MTDTELPLNCVAQGEDCLDGLSFCSNVQQTCSWDCVSASAQSFITLKAGNKAFANKAFFIEQDILNPIERWCVYPVRERWSEHIRGIVYGSVTCSGSG